MRISSRAARPSGQAEQFSRMNVLCGMTGGAPSNRRRSARTEAVLFVRAPSPGTATVAGPVVFVGEVAGDLAGSAVSFAGDVDGNGSDDLL